MRQKLLDQQSNLQIELQQKEARIELLSKQLVMLCSNQEDSVCCVTQKAAHADPEQQQLQLAHVEGLLAASRQATASAQAQYGKLVGILVRLQGAQDRQSELLLRQLLHTQHEEASAPDSQKQHQVQDQVTLQTPYIELLWK